MAMRLYWPKDEALEGKWTAPPLNRRVNPTGRTSLVEAADRNDRPMPATSDFGTFEKCSPILRTSVHGGRLEVPGVRQS